MNVKASFALLLLIASTGPMAGMYRSPKELRRDGIGGRLKKVIVFCLIVGLAYRVGAMCSNESSGAEAITFDGPQYVRESQCELHPGYHTSIECTEGWLINAKKERLAKVCGCGGVKVENEEQIFLDSSRRMCGAEIETPDEHHIMAGECFYEALQDPQEYTYMSGFPEQLKSTLAYVKKSIKTFLPEGTLIHPTKDKR